MHVQPLKNTLLACILLVAGYGSTRADLVTGNIAVYNGTTKLGYFSDVYDGQNTFTLTSDVSNALEVQIDTAASAPFTLKAINPPLSNLYVGAVGGSGGYYFGSGQSGYAYITDMASTSAGATPSMVSTDLQPLGYPAPGESGIWSLTGNVLSAQWINSDSTSSSAVAFYDPVVDYLGLTGDLAKYNSNFGDNASLVTFEFTGMLTENTPEPSTLALGLIGLGLVGWVVRRKRHATGTV